MSNFSEFAHSIKNPHIIHFIKRYPEIRYLCAGGPVTPEKMTVMKGKVTCKNCLRKLGKERK